MTTEQSPAIEPAMTWDELKTATGKDTETIQALIRQGVIPGVAVKVEGSSRFTYIVPRVAFLRWLNDPAGAPVTSPRPLVRPVARPA